MHGAVEVSGEFDEAVISGVADGADMIDVEERNARLQRGIDVAIARYHDVGRAFVKGRDERGLVVVRYHARVRPHQRADAGLVLFGRFLRPGGDDDHAEILHGRHDRPGFVAASEDEHALAGKALAQRRQRRLDFGLLARDHRFRASAEIGDRRATAQNRGRLARCRRRRRNFPRRTGWRRSSCSLRATCSIGLGAHHHISLRAMHGLHLAKARIAGEGAEDPQPEFVEQRSDVPELAAYVPFADQIDVMRRNSNAFGRSGRRRRLARADHMFVDDVARDAVAEFLFP